MRQRLRAATAEGFDNLCRNPFCSRDLFRSYAAKYNSPDAVGGRWDEPDVPIIPA
jgi:hypothetical protein